MVACSSVGDAYVRRTNIPLKGGDNVTIREEKTIRFAVKGNFFEGVTERINDKMPETFEFRGRGERGECFSVDFLPDGHGGFVANCVVQYTHYVPEE